tara:strand:- start:2800 stop:3090 length:291 start_codon:yes stop_codon:yes gene_type:complete
MDGSCKRLKTTSTLQSSNKDHDLYGKNIVFTGFRDKVLNEKLENNYNVNISSTVSNNTHLVIANDPTKSSTKTDAANKLKIPIYSKEEFNAKYPEL